MKYLISHQMKVLASCLDNYKEIWNIIPMILRFSFENPKLGMDKLQARGRLNNYENLFSRIIKDLETIQKDEIAFVRPHPIFKNTDLLLKNFNELDGKSEISDKNSKNELLNIIKILYEKVLSLLKKSMSEDDLKVMDAIATLMKRYPFEVQTTIQQMKKIKQELDKIPDGKKRKEELQKELQRGLARTAKRKIKLFLDLDGCLTDFDKAVKKLGPKAAKGLADDAKEEEKQFMYDKIENKGPAFWSEMEWYPKGKELWNVVKKYNPTLLSSPGKFKWAPAGKEDWVNANLPGISLFLSEDKYQYAEMDNVLIDDSNKNIFAWKDADGIGILYEGDPESVREELKEIISQPG